MDNVEEIYINDLRPLAVESVLGFRKGDEIPLPRLHTVYLRSTWRFFPGYRRRMEWVLQSVCEMRKERQHPILKLELSLGYTMRDDDIADIKSHVQELIVIQM